jgi:hypothetical protein
MNFYGKIKDGRFAVYQRENFKKHLKKLGECDGVFSVRKRERMRSGEQNKLYWKMLSAIEKETGQKKDVWHEYFKARHLIDNSGSFPKVKSTAELNIVEFMEYIGKLTKNAAEFGVNLPTPDELF